MVIMRFKFGQRMKESRVFLVFLEIAGVSETRSFD
jgi:hypothetical protein